MRPRARHRSEGVAAGLAGASSPNHGPGAQDGPPLTTGARPCHCKQFGVFFLEWNCFPHLFHFLSGNTKEYEFPFSWY